MKDKRSPKIDFAQLELDIADVIIIAITSEELVSEINKKGCEILGYTKAEIVGRNWFDFFIPVRMRDRMKLLFHEMLSETNPLQHYENPVLTRLGEERMISWHNILLTDAKGKFVGTLSSGVDVTELKRAEKAVKESEMRLRTTLDSMLEGCEIIDYDWRYRYINDTAATQGRSSKEKLLGRTMMEMYPGIENTELYRNFQRCMTDRVSHQMETEFTFPDGSKGWFEARIEPVPEGILILSLDITKRRELEEELNRYRHRLEVSVAERTAEFSQEHEKLNLELQNRRRTEEELKLRSMILDNAKIPIFLINSRGDFLFANEAASTVYGYDQEELLNMNLRQLLPPEDAHLTKSRLKEVFKKHQIDTKTVHVLKDKTVMQVQVHQKLIRTTHGEFIVYVVQDITVKSRH